MGIYASLYHAMTAGQERSVPIYKRVETRRNTDVRARVLGVMDAPHPHGAPEREVEAESTAFVICHALGLDTSKASFPYVAVWASRERDEDPLKLIATSGQRITKAATRILDALSAKSMAPPGVATVA
jgi:hypothetical protein